MTTPPEADACCSASFRKSETNPKSEILMTEMLSQRDSPVLNFWPSLRPNASDATRSPSTGSAGSGKRDSCGRGPSRPVGETRPRWSGLRHHRRLCRCHPRVHVLTIDALIKAKEAVNRPRDREAIRHSRSSRLSSPVSTALINDNRHRCPRRPVEPLPPEAPLDMVNISTDRMLEFNPKSSKASP